MNELIKKIEINKLRDDYNKCDYYLNELNCGNISHLNEVIRFSEQKYQEFCLKDSEVVLLNTNFISTDLNIILQTKKNLIALKKMINEIIIKKFEKESEEKCV